jgi:adenylate cyclase
MFFQTREAGIHKQANSQRLNPFHPDWYWSDLAIAYYAARRYLDSLEASRQVVDRKFYWSLAREAACYAQLGRIDEARGRAAEALRMKPDFRISAVKLSYKNPEDAEHLFEGVRKAGLPD